jgi:hypothetical protein
MNCDESMPLKDDVTSKLLDMFVTTLSAATEFK